MIYVNICKNVIVINFNNVVANILRVCNVSVSVFNNVIVNILDNVVMDVFNNVIVGEGK